MQSPKGLWLLRLFLSAPGKGWKSSGVPSKEGRSVVCRAFVSERDFGKIRGKKGERELVLTLPGKDLFFSCQGIQGAVESLVVVPGAEVPSLFFEGGGRQGAVELPGWSPVLRRRLLRSDRRAAERRRRHPPRRACHRHRYTGERCRSSSLRWPRPASLPNGSGIRIRQIRPRHTAGGFPGFPPPLRTPRGSSPERLLPPGFLRVPAARPCRSGSIGSAFRDAGGRIV